MRHRLLSYLFACVLAVLVLPAQAIIIGISPTQSSVVVDSTVGISVDISGLGQASTPSVGAYDISFSFDPAILQLTAVHVGDPALGDQLDLFGLGSLQSVQTQGGMVNVAQISLDLPADLDSLQAPAFTLVRFDFDAIGAGTASLMLQLNALADANGDALPAQLQSARVVVVDGGSGPGTPIPEPGTAILMAAGLACLGRRNITRR